MEAADLSEGLRLLMGGKRAKNGKAKAVSFAQGSNGDAPGPDRAVKAAIGGRSKEAPPSMQQRLVKAKLLGSSEAALKEDQERIKGSAPVLAFVPSSKFVGARPGSIFKFGDLGLGYYRDLPLAGKGKKSAKDKLGAAGKGPAVIPRSKAPIIPAGGSIKRKGGDWSDSDDDLEPRPAMKQSLTGVVGLGKAAGKQDKKKSLPGRLRKKLARDSGRS